MKLTKKNIKELTEDYGVKFSDKLGLSSEDSILVIQKALEGGETEINRIEDWMENRFIPNLVQINKDEYALVCVNALKGTSKNDGLRGLLSLCVY